MVVGGFKASFVMLGSMVVSILHFVAYFKAIWPFHRDCRSLLIVGRAVSS
jgi:hypothetical protein